MCCHGPSRVYRDGRFETDVTDPIETAITYVEARTRIRLTGEPLGAKTYPLVIAGEGVATHMPDLGLPNIHRGMKESCGRRVRRLACDS
ncbi:hypothetical protein Areg01_28230 [Actinoplanes regularis]|nr:hypothetical protein Areg01_28230 [Actinoplanes regularis]